MTSVGLWQSPSWTRVELRSDYRGLVCRSDQCFRVVLFILAVMMHFAIYMTYSRGVASVASMPGAVAQTPIVRGAILVNLVQTFRLGSFHDMLLPAVFLYASAF